MDGITSSGAARPASRVPPSGSRAADGVRPATIVGGIVAFLVLDQLLLWRFLGLATPLVAAIAIAGAIAGGIGCALRWRRTADPVGMVLPWPLIGLCFAASLGVFVLGGEARLFYANTDWQVRGAVLRDLVAYPWPFAYAGPRPTMLRLPLGMYLLPAAIGKPFGFAAAEWALLVQNSALLTGVLALGATVFATTRARLIALGVFLGFSGMDVVGALFVGHSPFGHLERWSVYQFSSHVTQAFWVPQHALAGWIGAVFYLLWRDGRASPLLPIGVFPLLALLSPLALIGLVPFVAHAAIGLGGSPARLRALLRPARLRGLLPPGLALLISLPAFAYLAAAADTVGGHVEAPPILRYLSFEGLEVAPFLIGLRLADRDRFGLSTWCLVAAVLLLAPLGKIGASTDLVMRASIPALAILAVLVADRLADPAARAGRWVLATAFAIGLATPVAEIGRTLAYPRSPAPLCSYLGVVPGGAATYVAPLARMPAWLRHPAPTPVRPRDPKRCWDGPWPGPVV